jgi:RNA polymerase sigma factor (sigma-70 family)
MNATDPNHEAPCPDDGLITRAIGGDQAAAAELLRTHGAGIHSRIAAKISPVWRSSIDADDVMQVTYIDALLRVRSFQPRHEGSFGAWLGRIAEHNLLDAIKELERAKRPNPKNRVQASGDDSYVALVEVLGATMTTPSLIAARGEVRSALERAIERLPLDYQRAVRLCDIEGKSAAEAAMELGRRPGAVYMLVMRAHDRLREILGHSSQFFTRRA